MDRRGRLSSGDLLRMLSALGELEPRFRRSTQQQLLLETALVRFALLDRTVAIEDVLKNMGGESNASPGGSASARVNPAAPGRTSMGSSGFRTAETPASVQRIADMPPPARVPTPVRATPAANVAIEPQPTPSQPMRALTASGRATVPVSDLNAVAGIWDDMIAAVRRDRPFIATLLEQSLPISTNANGVLVLQVEAPVVQEGLAAKMTETLGVMSGWLAGLQRLTVRLAGDSLAGPAPRMTVETVRSETLAALRKRDPVLNAAIDALDLDLVN